MRLLLPPLLLTACAGSVLDEFTADEVERVGRHWPSPAPPPDPTNAVAELPEAAALGQFLYFDTRLSGNGEVACATCHDPELGFADGLRLAEGIGTAGRGAPTVLDTVYNRWFFWDGRADSHWAQAMGPLENPVEHGTTRLEVAHLVAADAELSAAYESIYGPLPDLSDPVRFPAAGRPSGDPSDPMEQAWSSMQAADQEAITRLFVNLAKAIAAYERLIVSGEAPFDRFAAALLGQGPPEDLEVLSPSARLGLRVFLEPDGCAECHAGPLFADLEFHNLQMANRDWHRDDDWGRFDGVPEVLANPFNGLGPYSDDTTQEANEPLLFLVQTSEQIGQFKTPSLRNVTRTAPYMHAGQFDTLEQVVDFYSELEEQGSIGHREEFVVPRQFTHEERQGLLDFLAALEGPLPEASLLATPPSPLP